MSEEAEHNDSPLIFFFFKYRQSLFLWEQVCLCLDVAINGKYFRVPWKQLHTYSTFWIPVHMTIMFLSSLLRDRTVAPRGRLLIQKISKSPLNMFAPKGPVLVSMQVLALFGGLTSLHIPWHINLFKASHKTYKLIRWGTFFCVWELGDAHLCLTKYTFWPFGLLKSASICTINPNSNCWP